MVERKRSVLPQRDAYLLRQRINRTGGYHVRALRRLHSSAFYEVIVDDLRTGELFAVQSDADWYTGVRRPVVEADDLPPAARRGAMMRSASAGWYGQEAYTSFDEALRAADTPLGV